MYMLDWDSMFTIAQVRRYFFLFYKDLYKMTLDKYLTNHDIQSLIELFQLAIEMELLFPHTSY